MNGSMSYELDLPPGFSAISLREHRDAHTHACAVAVEAGAGTLVFVRRFDTVEAAVVLEPEEPLSDARRAIYAVMTAVGDALSAHSPPEKPLTFSWPDTINLDGGIVGGCRMSWPQATPELAQPDWLVASFLLRLAVPLAKPVSGGHPLDITGVKGTSLELEGFEMRDAAAIVSSFARHLMVQFDIWKEKGFSPVGEQYLARLTEETAMTRGIDGNGDLLSRSLQFPAEIRRHSLVEALRQPQWCDPETGEPWL